MRFLSYLTALLVAVLLAACGGGGGSSGSNPNRPTIFTTAPAELSLPIGAVRQYEIRGGVAPYTVSTANPRIVKTAFSGEVFTVNAVGQGSAAINVMDNNGGTVSINVTVGDPLKLSMTNLKGFVGDKVKVFITGGTPPYKVSPGDFFVNAFVNGSELSMTLQDVGKVDLSVTDALNKSATINVEVTLGSPQFNLSPAEQTISENSTQDIVLNVIGGSAPFTVTSSDTNLLRASIYGNVVTLTTGTNGERCVVKTETVIVTVTDSRGGTGVSKVVLANNPEGCGLWVSNNPATVIVGESVQLALRGSETGAISLMSSGSDRVTATYSNGIITVKGLATTWVAEVPGIPAGCGVGSAPACTTAPVPAHDEPVTITVIDSGPPTRSLTFLVTVLRKTP